MLRDTPSGYRYLSRSTGASAAEGRPDEAARDVADRASHVRTMVMGAIFDPNISHPLPFAGLSYVDFDLFGTGTQLNGFFGGTFGQLAISVPSMGGTRWQLGGRAFAMLSSFNDRAFVDGLEHYDANISQRPAHGSVWLIRPLSTRVSIKAGYEVDYTRYRASVTTRPHLHRSSRSARPRISRIRRCSAGWLAGERVVESGHPRWLAALGPARGQRVSVHSSRLSAGRRFGDAGDRAVTRAGGSRRGKLDGGARPRPVQPDGL